jgi:hypothetical protein
LAYLNSQETKDSVKIIKNYKKSLFLNPYDFLLNNYYGKYCMAQQNEKKGLYFFRTSLQCYGSVKSSNYGRNYFFSKIPILNNSIIPNNLLYYTTPDPQALYVFNAFQNQHGINIKDKDFYSQMIKSYSHKLFKQELRLP